MIADGGYPDSVATRDIDGGDPGVPFFPTAPLLTPFTDAAPCPRVRIEFTEFDAGTETATVHRVADGEDLIVPGADNVGALGGLVRTDFYPPFGVPVRYYAEQFDAAGLRIGVTASATVTLDVVDAWISSPIDPRKSVRVDMEAEAASSLVNPVDAVVHNIGGRRILIAEASYGLDDLDMSFWVLTVAEQRTAAALFRDADGVVVFRVPPPMEIPRVLYAFGVPRRSETNLPGGVEDFLFSLTVTEVSAPTTQVIVAQLPYSRFARYFPSYRAFKSAYSSYRDALLNPPPEV